MAERDTPESSQQDPLQLLQQALQQREYEISLLRETVTIIGSELDLEKVLRVIADRARELIHADTLLIPILDNDCNTYTYRAGSGSNSDEIVGESLPLEFGVCGWVWRHKRPWWRGMLSELTPDERNRWEKEAGTLILVPLVGRHHFLGGIAGINKLGAAEFDERDLQLLELFAGHAAIAIENAMAVQALEEARATAERFQVELHTLNRRLTQANLELEQLTLYDQLTHLPNRSLFHDRLSQQLDLSRQSGEKFCVMIIDIDNFQVINEALGHEAGDQLLRVAAQRFSKVLTNNQTLCRMSGDEFGVLLSNTEVESARKAGEEMRNHFSERVVLQGREMSVTASIGIASYPANGNSIPELLKHADVAMLTAKREKQGVHIFDPAVDKLVTGRLALVRDLQKALDEQEFQLHFQPKVALASGSIVGVEALARWPHPSRGPVSPEMFISALEQTGLIDAFSYWVIEHSLEQRARWLQRGWDLKVAVNIPITLVLEDDFIPRLDSILQRFPGIGGLLFEITESLFLSNYDRLHCAMQAIGQFGIEISIDDFGTGHSSLSRLRQLPVSELKIDRSFVSDMLASHDDEAIVRSTIDLAHNLGLRVVAEGVEDEAVMEQLYRMRCDVVQGYHISKPQPAEVLDTFMTKGKWRIAGRTPIVSDEPQETGE